MVRIGLKKHMVGTLKYLAGTAGPSGYGSNSTAEQVTDGCMPFYSSPLTAIVTGATSGIGAETARVMARRGVRVVMGIRDVKKGEEVKEIIKKNNKKAEIIILELDLSSFSSIKRFCTLFLSMDLPLNILINNAGMYNKKLEYSEEKIEMTFAINYLGHYMVTELLVEKMIESATASGIEGRIINLSSVVHKWVHPPCPTFSHFTHPLKRYNATQAYAQSKLAAILHAKELAKILQGAATTCYVALSGRTRGVTGKYFADCNERSCSVLARDDDESQKLWRETENLIRQHS